MNGIDGEFDPKPVFWMASSRRDVREFPKQIRATVGQALFDAQLGDRHPSTKVLKGFGGAHILEIVDDDSSGTYRSVYTVKFARAIYVLHVFQKKSKAGIRTPPDEIAKVRRRLVQAEKHYAEWIEEQE